MAQITNTKIKIQTTSCNARKALLSSQPLLTLLTTRLTDAPLISLSMEWFGLLLNFVKKES